MLTQHLQEASGQVELAVNQICERFESIATRTQAQLGVAAGHDTRTTTVDAGIGSDGDRGVDSGPSTDPTLDRDIAELVVALQFQDAVSQRLTEISGALSELESVLTVWRDVPPGSRHGKEGAGYEKWNERLTRFSRLEDAGVTEHIEHAERTEDEGQSAADALGSNGSPNAITLF